MEFQNYSKQINLMKEIENFGQLTRWNGSLKSWKIKICTNKW